MVATNNETQVLYIPSIHQPLQKVHQGPHASYGLEFK